MRLFAAVLPPPHAAYELAAALGRVKQLDGAGTLRWAGRPGWHFTLAFYGEVPVETVPDLSDRLDRAARRTAPFPLALHGGGQFGGRILWAGAEGDVHTMRLLADRAEAAGRKAGIAMGEHRRYRPHVSLARSRRPLDLRPYVAELAAFVGSEWTVDQLALVRSRLPKSGVPGEQPRYETVAHWALEAGA